MLVDQHDADVLALGGEALEGGLDGRRVGLPVDHEEVLLRVRRVRDVLFFPRAHPTTPVVLGTCVLPCVENGGREGFFFFLTPMPASSRPVTES